MTTTDPYLVISYTSANHTPTVHDGGNNITVARARAKAMAEKLYERNFEMYEERNDIIEQLRQGKVIGYTVSGMYHDTTIMVARNMMNRGEVDEDA